MGYRIEWLLENRVIVLRYLGVSDIKDLDDQDKIILDMLNDHPTASVHLLVDAIHAQGKPPFQAFRKLKHPRHPALGWTVILSSTSTLQMFFANVIAHIVGSRLQIRYTWQEALALLNELDDTLPKLEAIPYGVDTHQKTKTP